MKCIKQYIIVAKIINSIKINYFNLNSLIINILLVLKLKKKKDFFMDLILKCFLK